MKMCNGCGRVCGLCPRVIFSQAVTFADGTLTINLPAGSYGDGERYCIVIVQPIPEETTISAAVVITIGEGTAGVQTGDCGGDQSESSLSGARFDQRNRRRL